MKKASGFPKAEPSQLDVAPKKHASGLQLIHLLKQCADSQCAIGLQASPHDVSPHTCVESLTSLNLAYRPRDVSGLASSFTNPFFSSTICRRGIREQWPSLAVGCGLRAESAECSARLKSHASIILVQGTPSMPAKHISHEKYAFDAGSVISVTSCS
jgi:hypothetical protein